MEDIRKSICIKFFETYVSFVINTLLVENRRIVEFFSNNNMNLYIKDIVDLPLWMISGGECVNLYCHPDYLSATKDIDLKLILSDKYSLPLDFIKNSISQNLYNLLNMENLLNYNLSDKNFWSVYETFENRMKLEREYEKIKNYLSNIDNDYPYLFYNTLESKIIVIYKIMSSFKEQFNQNQYILSYNGKDFISVEYLMNIDSSNINELRNYLSTRDGILEDEENVYIPLYIMIPRINYGFLNSKEFNFPFHIIYPQNDSNGNILNLYYDEYDLDNFKLLLQNVDQSIKSFFELDNAYIIEYIKLISLLNYERNLTSLMNTKIIISINKTTNEWNIKIYDEGFVDIWIEYSAKYTNTIEKEKYESRTSSGDIPSIVEIFKARNEDKEFLSFLKIPTVSWILRDQVKMLMHGLREDQPLFDTNGNFVFISSNVDPLKYSQKIKGIITGYKTIIETIKKDIEDGKSDIQSLPFETCKRMFDFIACGPDAYLSYLFKKLNKNYWKRIGYNKLIDTTRDMFGLITNEEFSRVDILDTDIEMLDVFSSQENPYIPININI